MIDQLYKSVEQNGVVCLGLDTKLDYLPAHLLQKYTTVEEQLFQFNRAIIEATKDVVACYKVQIAYYEAYGLAGLRAYQRTLQYLKRVQAITIADIKRGDIADTAAQYAKAHFSGDFESDFVTLNPYMGYDTLGPFLPYLKQGNKGVFVLVRTSNEGAKDIQDQDVANKKLYQVVGEGLEHLGTSYLGQCGYSAIGAVIGCTNTEEAVKIRKMLDKTFFLIPGYGTQGGTAHDVASLLKNGNGGVVNASRSILLHYQKFSDGANRFDELAYLAATAMRSEIEGAIHDDAI